MFDLTTVGPAVITIGGFSAVIAFIHALGRTPTNPLDDSLPRGRQEEEPVRFRFPALAPTAKAGAAA
jgi:hypothetical protein